MTGHTLYLDAAIAAAVVYPAGLAYSLYTSWWGFPRQVSTRLLAMLALPAALVVPAVHALRPELVALNGTGSSWLAAALLAAPLALGVEWCVHAGAIVATTGHRPSGVGLPEFWTPRLSPGGHVLLACIAVGEELFYRAIWIGLLLSLGAGPVLALLISATAYGLNHLSFGAATVVAKSMTGLIYGGLLVATGSISVPIAAHVLQNVLVLRLARPRHA